MYFSDIMEVGSVKKSSVSNEVLGNVLRGLEYNISDEDIFTIVENTFSSDEVYRARKILVKYFYDLFENEEPNGRFMGPMERDMKKDENICDIIEKLQEIVKSDHDVDFCVPWNYSFVVVSDAEQRLRQIVDQEKLEINSKFEALEKMIDIKSKEVVNTVQTMISKNPIVTNNDKESPEIQIIEKSLFKGRFFQGIIILR